MSVRPPGEPEHRRGPADGSREPWSSLALVVGIVVAGFVARAVGLDTGDLATALGVVTVGVGLGVVLRKAIPRR